MKAYKGFNPDMTCSGFQYEEGKTYETDEAALCKKGFHACLAPMDVFSYYPPCGDNGNLNKFHEVELEEVDERRDKDTKVCAKKISIGAELNFFGLAKAHVEYVKEHVDKDNVKDADGDRSAASATGDWSAASVTGNRSAASATGDWSAASATGDWSAASATGERSAASVTGNRSAASVTGYRSAASATGDRSAASVTGERSAASVTGERSAASATGDWSAATAEGKESVALAWGVDGKAKAALGSYIALAEWEEDEDGYKLVCARMHKVDGKIIKPDTFYKLKGGKFVEVKE